MTMDNVTATADTNPVTQLLADQQALLQDWVGMTPDSPKVADDVLAGLSEQLLTTLLTRLAIGMESGISAQDPKLEDIDQMTLQCLATLCAEAGNGLSGAFQHLARLSQVMIDHASVSFNGNVSVFAVLCQGVQRVIEGWRQKLLTTANSPASNSSTLHTVFQKLLHTNQALHEHVCTALQRVLMDTEAAVGQMFSQQQAICDSSNKLHTDLQHFNDRSENLQDDFEANLQVITEASQAAVQLPEQLRKERSKLGQLLETVLDLADRTNMIKRISSETRSLSINAKIEAVRAGEYGKGFSVVADEVRTLSKNSLEASEQIQDKLKTLNEIMSKNFAQGFEENLREKENVVNDMGQATHQLAQVWQRMRGFYRDELSDTMADNIALADNVTGLSSIQFQDIVRQKIERLTDLLNQQNDVLMQLQAQLMEHNGFRDPDLRSLVTVMQTNLDNYLVEEQGHNDFDLGEGASANKIELF
jgi:methyl-accepting chemotaxis protein